MPEKSGLAINLPFTKRIELNRGKAQLSALRR
jgi:hypothetical protein